MFIRSIIDLNDHSALHFNILHSLQACQQVCFIWIMQIVILWNVPADFSRMDHDILKSQASHLLCVTVVVKSIFAALANPIAELIEKKSQYIRYYGSVGGEGNSQLVCLISKLVIVVLYGRCPVMESFCLTIRQMLALSIF